MYTHIPHRSHSDYLIIEGLSCHINNNQNACHSMGTFSSTRCIIQTAPWSLFYINRLLPVYMQKKNKTNIVPLLWEPQRFPQISLKRFPRGKNTTSEDSFSWDLECHLERGNDRRRSWRLICIKERALILKPVAHGWIVLLGLPQVQAFLSSLPVNSGSYSVSTG